MVWPWPPDMACTIMGCPDDVMSCPPLTWTIRGCPWTYREIQNIIRALPVHVASVPLMCDAQDRKQMISNQEHPWYHIMDRCAWWFAVILSRLGCTMMKPSSSIVNPNCSPFTVCPQIYKTSAFIGFVCDGILLQSLVYVNLKWPSN